jgi:L-threonylcarbamoyladenylate synthase
MRLVDNEHMRTLRLPVDPDRIHQPESQQSLAQAASILRRGGTVAFPTETVYGLGANALDAEAVAAIFRAKERPAWDPLIVHVCDQEMLTTLVTEIPETARQLMAAFWPGPLTLLLPRSPAVPDAVTAGRPLVGVRMPAHPVALELIRRAGVPLAAPSANRFGHTSPTTADHVLDDLDGRIDAVLDAGETTVGLESTVLDATASPLLIYRPGAITLDQIRAIAGPVELFQEPADLDAEPRGSMPSPGTGLRHYAPKARLILVEAGQGKKADMASGVEGTATVFSHEHVGVMYATGLPGEQSMFESLDHLDFAQVYPWGNWSNPDDLAHRLYAGLRHLDALGCTVIVCPMPPEQGIGAAIRDRLRKAAWRGPDQP